jgi:hypothetical protein
MAWTRLPVTPRDDLLPAEISKTAAKLDQAIADLQNGRDALDEQQAAAREIPLEKIDPHATRQALESARCRLLADELGLRRRLDAYLDDYRAWAAAAASVAFEDHLKAETTIRRRLKRLGFHDVPATELCRGKILPSMVSTHPAVFAARDRHEALRSRAVDNTQRQQNRQAIESLERTLEGIRDAVGIA